MSTIDDQEFLGDTQRNTVVISPGCCDDDPVPQQLMEIIELMDSINRRFEDCAVDWQSMVSRKQWRILDVNLKSQKTWENSLHARTYFTEKAKDDAFQSLLVQDRKFTKQLNDFVALLRGKNTSTNPTAICDAQNQCPDEQSMDCQEIERSPAVEIPDVMLLDERVSGSRRNSKRLVEPGNAMTNPKNVQQSFVDLIEAKINFDTKFLRFESALNGTVTPCNEPMCLYQMCSSILSNAVEKGNVVKTIGAVRQKVERAAKSKAKRLTKSPRTLIERRSRNQTKSLSNIKDQ